MLSLDGINNIIQSPRSRIGNVRRAFYAVLGNTCSPFDVYFEHLQTLNIEEIIKNIHNEVYTQNEYYSDFIDVQADNPMLLEQFTERASEVIIDTFLQEKFDFGDNIPHDFGYNFAVGIHQAIVFDEAFDSCFD